MISTTITTVTGASRRMKFDDADAVRTFIEQLPARLSDGVRVRVTCDLLGINAYVTGEAK